VRLDEFLHLFPPVDQKHYLKTLSEDYDNKDKFFWLFENEDYKEWNSIRTKKGRISGGGTKKNPSIR
jgi:hypothetical protein